MHYHYSRLYNDELAKKQFPLCLSNYVQSCIYLHFACIKDFVFWRLYIYKQTHKIRQWERNTHTYVHMYIFVCVCLSTFFLQYNLFFVIETERSHSISLLTENSELHWAPWPKHTAESLKIRARSRWNKWERRVISEPLRAVKNNTGFPLFWNCHFYFPMQREEEIKHRELNNTAPTFMHLPQSLNGLNLCGFGLVNTALRKCY